MQKSKKQKTAKGNNKERITNGKKETLTKKPFVTSTLRKRK
jgi:hypothetical protein